MARILVVDDDEDVLDSLEASLVDAGHEVLGARSVERALAADPARFDVLLVDLWLRPGPNGLQLKEELGRRDVTVPVILMSSDDDVALYAVRAGMIEYLHKPFSPDQLHAGINRALAEAPSVSAEAPAVAEAPAPDEQPEDKGDEPK
jgi:DNA-binding NtrC family response regulator